MSTERFPGMLDSDPTPDPTDLTPEPTPPSMPPTAEARALRFGRFEADLETGLLTRDGTPVRFQPQPFKVLVLLARRAGQVVTRDEIRLEVWGEDTFVNFDQGLAYCLNQIRGALGEQAQAHRYVQTLPRRGYRFIAPVTVVPRGSREDASGRAADDARGATPAPSPRPARASAVAAVLLALVTVRSLPTPASGDARTLIVVLPFEELGRRDLGGAPGRRHDRGDDHGDRPPQPGAAGRDRARLGHALQGRASGPGACWAASWA